MAEEASGAGPCAAQGSGWAGGEESDPRGSQRERAGSFWIEAEPWQWRRLANLVAGTEERGSDEPRRGRERIKYPGSSGARPDPMKTKPAVELPTVPARERETDRVRGREGRKGSTGNNVRMTWEEAVVLSGTRFDSGEVAAQRWRRGRGPASGSGRRRRRGSRRRCDAVVSGPDRHGRAVDGSGGPR